MNRPWQIWALYLLCLAFVLPGMGWLSLKALQLDRARAAAQRQTEQARRQAELARHQAETQELISSALWRMDWTLTPLVAQEAARPYYVYDSFYAVPGGKAGVRQAASPLLVQPSQYVLLHFQLSPDGRWTSPQSPTGLAVQQAIDGGAPRENIQASARRLARLSQQINPRELLAMLPGELLPAIEVSQRPWAANLSLNYDGSRLAVTNDFGIQQLRPSQQLERRQADVQEDASQTESAEPQTASSPQRRSGPQRAEAEGGQANRPPGVGEQRPGRRPATRRLQPQRGSEWQTRNRAYEAYANTQLVQQRAQRALIPLAKQEAVREGVSRPVWVGSKLLLARRVLQNDQVLIQGCWLNWPKIRQMLLAEIADLLPDADLVPVTPASHLQPGRTLATLPVQVVLPAPSAPSRFDPARPPAAENLSAIQLSLIIAWGCLLVAAAAVAVLLLGVVTLSERRAAFVSAVTHELRTPLTTFRMYAEMLAGGMVPSAERRREYLATLRAESDRLAHLVENVLSYARLERGRCGRRRETVTIHSLIDQVQPRLSERASQAAMKLVIDVDPAARAVKLRTDPVAVEQVLFNLVDNACKYAATAEDRRIHLRVEPAGKAIRLSVRDHGRGISPHEVKRLFRPFSKSVEQAAQSAPGVGLGLALCRRLARSLRGRLQLDRPEDGGAAFVLTLPKA